MYTRNTRIIWCYNVWCKVVTCAKTYGHRHYKPITKAAHDVNPKTKRVPRGRNKDFVNRVPGRYASGKTASSRVGTTDMQPINLRFFVFFSNYHGTTFIKRHLDSTQSRQGALTD